MCYFDKNIVDLDMQTSYITEHYPKLQSKHQKEKKKKKNQEFKRRIIQKANALM